MKTAYKALELLVAIGLLIIVVSILFFDEWIETYTRAYVLLTLFVVLIAFNFEWIKKNVFGVKE